MGTDRVPARVSQHRLDGAPAAQAPALAAARSPPLPSTDPPATGTPAPPPFAPGTDDGALELRRRRWATERARFEAAHPFPAPESTDHR